MGSHCPKYPEVSSRGTSNMPGDTDRTRSTRLEHFCLAPPCQSVMRGRGWITIHHAAGLEAGLNWTGQEAAQEHPGNIWPGTFRSLWPGAAQPRLSIYLPLLAPRRVSAARGSAPAWTPPHGRRVIKRMERSTNLRFPAAFFNPSTHTHSHGVKNCLPPYVPLQICG
jgi:hypothetical protein